MAASRRRLRRAIYLFAAGILVPLNVQAQAQAGANSPPTRATQQHDAYSHMAGQGHAQTQYHAYDYNNYGVYHHAVPTTTYSHHPINNTYQAAVHTEGGAAVHSSASDPAELLTHSWEVPLTQEDLSQWDVAMSSSPTHEHVMLMPASPNTTGQFWHRQAIPTNNFEVQFGFNVIGKDQTAQGNSAPGGFAFWYVYESYAEVYPKSPEEQAAWNLFGYKSNPKGLGIFFKSVNREGISSPSISCIHNTADDRAIADELPAPSALFYQYRNRPSPVHFKVTIGKDGVTAHIRDSVSADWLAVCHLDNVILRPNGFIGFTGYNGQVVGNGTSQRQQQEQKLGGDRVLLQFVKVRNLETASASSPKLHTHQPIHQATAHGYGTYGTYDHAYHTHGADAMHLWHAHANAYNYQQNYQLEQTMMSMLTSVDRKISALSTDFHNLLEDIRKLGGEKHPELVESLKSDITGLTNLFKRHSQQQTSTLQTIHKTVEGNAGAVKGNDPTITSQLIDLSSQLEKTIAMKQAHSFVLFVGAILLFILFVAFVWKKFSDMEKKHLL